MATHDKYVECATDDSVEKERTRRISLLFQREKDFLEIGKGFCELKLDTFPSLPQHQLIGNGDRILFNLIEGLKHIKTVLGSSSKQTIFKNVVDLASKLTGASTANIHRKLRANDLSERKRKKPNQQNNNKQSKKRKTSKKNDSSDDSEEIEEEEEDEEVVAQRRVDKLKEEEEIEEELALSSDYQNRHQSSSDDHPITLLTLEDMKSYIAGKEEEQMHKQIYRSKKGRNARADVKKSQPSSSSSTGSPFALMNKPSRRNEPKSTVNVLLKDESETPNSSRFRVDQHLAHGLLMQKGFPVKSTSVLENLGGRKATTDIARLTIAEAILMFPRAIFSWAEFLAHAGPTITTYSERLIRIVLFNLERDGLLFTVCGSHINYLDMRTVFMKETRATMLEPLILYKFNSEVYMQRIFGKPHMKISNWIPLMDQIAGFDVDSVNPLTASNPRDQLYPEVLEHTLCLAILQTKGLTVTPEDVKVNNLLMLDNAFNRLQREQLIAPANMTSPEPINWEFEKVFFVSQTNDRLIYYYGVDSTYMPCLSSFLPVAPEPNEEVAKEEIDQVEEEESSPVVTINTLEDILMATEAASSNLETPDPEDDNGLVDVKKEIMD